MFHKRYRLFAGVILAALLALGLPTLTHHSYAAPTAQGVLTFGDPTPITGALNDAAPEVLYAFDCFRGNPGSVVVRVTSGNLRVNLSVQDGTGAILKQGGMVRPDVAVLALFEPTGDGLCTLTLSREGNTAGEYTLRLLPGYDRLDVFDRFDGGDMGLEWPPYTSDAEISGIIEQGQMKLQIMTDNWLAYTVPNAAEERTWSDFYIQADFTIEGSPSYYEYGFVLRTTGQVSPFYALTLSSDGDWSLAWYGENDEWEAIQKWTVSPVIDGTDHNPRVAVWVQGNVFRLYFNNRFVGEVTDPNSRRLEGGFGLASGTLRDQKDTLTVYVDNLVVTVPAGGGAPPLPNTGAGSTGAPAQATAAPMGGLLGALGQGNQAAPQPTQAPNSAGPRMLTSWQSDDPQTIVQELQSMGLVPPNGTLSLTVPSSYGDTSNAGFSYYTMGEGKTFRNFVLSFDTRLLQGATESGCGMFFRDTDTYNADAIIFADGSFLLGEWDAQGDLTDASVLQYSDAVKEGLGETNRVVVVANEAQVTMFVNGQQVAEATFQPNTGPVALEMYVDKDDNGQTQETYCQLNNIWLWEY